MTFPAFLRLGSSVFGVLRNFRSHAAEMGSAVPTAPVYFLKPPASYVLSGERVVIPPALSEVHYEGELGVVIGKGGKNISESSALEYVQGYVGALDVTSRDWQSQAKGQGLPWALCKGADTFCGVSRDVIPASRVRDPAQFRVWLSVNGTVRQDALASDMVFPVPQLIAAISEHVTLQEGDLILTGTPAGVGPLRRGDVVQGGVELAGGASSVFSFEVV